MSIYSDKFFEKPIKIIEAKDDLREAFLEIDKLRKEFYLLGYVDYDFKYLYFEVYKDYKKFIPSQAKKLGTFVSPKISKSEYVNAISKIKEYIKNGVTYEVNYTYPSEVLTNLDGIELYEALLEKQRTPYNTFISTPKINLLSFSPELFFRLEGNKILTKPMKGTVARGKDLEEDKKNKDFLYNDIKNRAENIMIVDLLRNDLGVIAKTGTVKVDKLFDIESHPTVFQMTSEISAELDNEVTLYDIFKAIFPCGSITGAPKLSTMRVIDELEPFNRNIYCGAIGFLSPEVCEFSVPIRILYGKDYKYNYHAGGAIVWDSDAEDEWNETITKTKFINTDFSLIETAADDWERHCRRMKKSALALGFIWNEEIENIELKGVTRVLLNKNGEYSVEYDKKLKPITSNKIRISRKVNSNNIFLYHKTTIRENMPSDVFDEIGVNEKGEITEGIFTNIAVKFGENLFTPPLKSGLLNGTFRQKLLDEGKMQEKIIYPEDLKNADKIFCFNSIRKMVEVELC